MSTKIIAIALSALVGSATLAAADVNYFSVERVQDTSSRLDLGTIRAASDGVVEVYDYRGGSLGELLGTVPVYAGANGDVQVNVGTAPLGNVVALLTIDGETVATQRFELNQR